MKSSSDESSDDSSDSISELHSFGGIVHSPISAVATSEADDQDGTSEIDGLEIVCRRVRFAQEALRHGQGKRHTISIDRIRCNVTEDSFDEPGSRSPPLRASCPLRTGCRFFEAATSKFLSLIPCC